MTTLGWQLERSRAHEGGWEVWGDNCGLSVAASSSASGPVSACPRRICIGIGLALVVQVRVYLAYDALYTPSKVSLRLPPPPPPTLSVCPSRRPIKYQKSAIKLRAAGTNAARKTATHSLRNYKKGHFHLENSLDLHSKSTWTEFLPTLKPCISLKSGIKRQIRRHSQTAISCAVEIFSQVCVGRSWTEFQLQLSKYDRDKETFSRRRVQLVRDQRVCATKLKTFNIQGNQKLILETSFLYHL